MEAGQPLERFEYDPGPLAPDAVEINVETCGICHSDLAILENEWRASEFPVVPGHEVIGTVGAVGEAVDNLTIGQRVGLGWSARSCMTCESCMSGRHHQCGKNIGTITGQYGGFADRVRAQAAWCVPLPEGIDAEKAGPLFCGGVTVFTPLKEYVLPTDRVGIIGIGGLGHMAIMMARAWGCEVTAFTSSPDKAAEARELGAHHVVNTHDSEALKAIAGRLNLIINTTNVALPWDRYFHTLAPNGHLVTVGVVVEKPMEVAAFSLIRGNKSLSGSLVGSPADIAKMLEFCARHRISPMIETFAMDDVNAALDHLRHGKPRYRIVLKR